MKNIIEIKHLSKSYGKHTAISDISFDVREGELFAFLGVNGAGKSTAINIICGQLEADGGEVTVDGWCYGTDSEKILRSLGVVFQGSVLDSTLTVYDNLESRAALYGIFGGEFKRKLEELSELLSLDRLMKKTVGRLSGGERRRVDIARALIHDPRILILDEPTTGLDPKTRKMLWDAIDMLQRNRNMTVFLTTHYMEEAAIADRVVIIDGGRIAECGTPLELKSKYAHDRLTVYGIGDGDARKLGIPYTHENGAHVFSIPSTAHATELIVKYPSLFSDYEVTKGDMDGVFLKITGKSLKNEHGEDEK